jgi:prepilin-type N-terminal cleavage/methylation domain-containing protein
MGIKLALSDCPCPLSKQSESIEGIMGKGFTLVEITIVMLIIGVIAALAIKGKDLVEVANVRAELRKLERFDLAIKNIVLKKSKVGSAEVFKSHYKFEDEEIPAAFFTDNRSLDENDFITYLVPESMRKSVLRKTPYGEDSDISISVKGTYTPQEACMIEYIMDDMKANSGRVIISAFSGVKESGDGSNSAENDASAQIFKDCVDWQNVYESGRNEVTLFYRVF